MAKTARFSPLRGLPEARLRAYLGYTPSTLDRKTKSEAQRISAEAVSKRKPLT